MPEMDLGDIRTLDLTTDAEFSGAMGNAGLRLFAYFSWPKTEERRKQFMATHGALALHEMSKSTPEDLGLSVPRY